MGHVLECLPVFPSGWPQQSSPTMASWEPLKSPVSATKTMVFLLALDRGGVGEEVPGVFKIQSQFYFHQLQVDTMVDL